MIKKFQKEYCEYWKDGTEIETADESLKAMYLMRDRRLGAEEIELIETVKGDVLQTEEKDEVQTYEAEERVTKKFVRFKHTLYEKTEVLKSRYAVKEGHVCSYVQPSNFDGTKGRYLWNASQAAVVIAAVLAMTMPFSSESLPLRIRNLLISLVIVSIPVALVCYALMRSVKAKQKERAESEEAYRIKAQKKFDENNIPVIYEEVMGVLDTQVKMIHYAVSEKEIKRIQMDKPEKIIRKYERIIDCSIGEVKFGDYAKEGKIEYLPAELTVYMLRSNGKTLVPEKERVHVMMERKIFDWKVTEYLVLRK